MANISKRDRTREKRSEIAAKNRRELIAEGLKRRDLLKMGLLTSAGMLIPKSGLSARPLTSAGFIYDDTPQSRPTTPFVEEMPRLVEKPFFTSPTSLTGPAPQPTPNPTFGESRQIDHQVFTDLPPVKYYEIHQKAFQAKSHPEFSQPSTLWGYDGIFPGPLFKAYYGEPMLVRHWNDLPPDGQNGGFGLNSTTTHLHNGHTPQESDGHPCFFNDRAHFYDHHYPNVLAGYRSTHPNVDPRIGIPGDIRESMHTLWYHDHRFDYTSQNVYKGLAGMFNLFHKNGQFDGGDENSGFRLPSYPNFDINMVFNDAVYDSQTDQLAFDLFNLDGILGDKFQVNGKVQPVLHVSPRRYRFRWLNMGPSRFYQFSILDPTNNSTKQIWQLSTDGNFLERPVKVDGVRISVAERTDVIVDFTGLAGKTFYIENRMEQTDGRGPTGNVLAAGAGNKVLKIVVDGPAVADNSVNFDTALASLPAGQPYFYGFPDTNTPIRVTRTFKFERNNGQWAVNGRFPNCLEPPRFAIQLNTAEKWIFQNNSGGWQHPIHMHFEEFQTLKINGQPPAVSGIVQAGRKDVLRLEHNMQAEVYFRFRDFKGKLPLHCHNVVHEDHAMMVLLEIKDVGDLNPNP